VRVAEGERCSVGGPWRNKHEVGEEGGEDSKVVLFEWETRVLDVHEGFVES